jgi:hypothetical protein
MYSINQIQNALENVIHPEKNKSIVALAEEIVKQVNLRNQNLKPTERVKIK